MADQLAAPIPVWLDCDPGHDDAFAILLAAYHPAIKLLGISTVFGNAPVEKTTANAISLLAAMKKDQIPVYRGASHAMCRPAMHHPADVHGESGIDGTSLLPQPPREANQDVSAVDAMAAALAAQPKGTACIVAVGAFTNVALLFEKHAHLVSHIKTLSVMGGAFGDNFSNACMGTVDDRQRIGNFTPWAEFNILADPEAAASIFSNEELASKTIVAPLDLTHQVLATEEVRNRLRFGEDGTKAETSKSVLRQMLYELLMYFADTYGKVYGMTDGPPLHDPVAVAAVLIGSSFEIPFSDQASHHDTISCLSERFSISVNTEGTYEDATAGRSQTGRTTLRKLSEGSLGVIIPRSLDVSAFWYAVEKCIQRADLAIGSQ